MKTIAKLIAISVAVISLLGITSAAPPGKGTCQPTRSAEKIASLKKGDRYVFVCRDCESAAIHEITGDAQAAELCHDDGKKDVTIKRTGTPGKVQMKKEAMYLDSKGDE
jgi:hypothetical protein